MPSERSIGRNVHIFDARNPTVALGGLILTGGITTSDFYAMMNILFIFTSDYQLQNEHGSMIPRNGDFLQPGSYYIVASGAFSVTDEMWLVRSISLSSGTRIRGFRDAVRARDGRCVITGQQVPGIYRNIWAGYDAAHIFPLAYEAHWVLHNYDRWITIAPACGGTINSLQNGLLLRSDIHALFDQYLVSINPDADYKIVCFERDANGVAGQHLNQDFRDHPDRPVDQLLRWHFRQAVLANMKGAGEPVFETDFPSGSDMMGEIHQGPKAPKRMEFELQSRLACLGTPLAEK